MANPLSWLFADEGERVRDRAPSPRSPLHALVENKDRQSAPNGLQRMLDSAALATTVVPGVGDAVGLTADAYRYATDPESRTWGNAALSAAGALPFVPSMAGMFVGKGAKTANLGALEKAKDLERSSADPRQIHAETGWFKGPEGEWKFEIDDSGARIGKKAEEDIALEGGTGDMRAPAVLWHKDLYEAYPELRNVTTNISQSDSYTGGGGAWDRNKRRIDIDVAGGSEARRSVNLHEIQHAVQDAEGFGRGGAPEEFHRMSFAAAQGDLNGIDEWIGIEPYVRAAGGDTARAREMFVKEHPGASAFSARHIDGLRQRFGDLDEAALENLYGQSHRVVDAGTPDEAYRRLAGEAEARTVQKRQDYTPDQRRAVFPLDDYDVPLDRLIVRR